VAEMMNKLNQLKTLLGKQGDNSEDDLLLMLLTLSAQKILDRVYPYDDKIEEVPSRYATKQIEIAVYLYNKRGARGKFPIMKTALIELTKVRTCPKVLCEE